jgi:hypothetical protein
VWPSDITTVTVCDISPERPLIFKSTGNTPEDPGANSPSGFSGTVQPQLLETSLIETGAPPVFLNANSPRTLVSPTSGRSTSSVDWKASPAREDATAQNNRTKPCKTARIFEGNTTET